MDTPLVDAKVQAGSTRKSATTQMKRVRALFKHTGVDFASLEFKHDVIMTFVDTLVPNTRNNYLQALASILKVTNRQDLYTLYSELSTLGRQTINNAADQNLLSDEEKDWPHWSEIRDLYLLAKGTDRLLMALYTLIPPRRLDIGTLRFMEGDNKITPACLTFSVYKTSKTYGTVTFHTPKAIIPLLTMAPGTRLFNTSNFSRLVTRTFARFHKKRITVNILRHSYISYFMSRPVSTEARKLVALKMGHSLEMQNQYFRINLLPQEITPTDGPQLPILPP